MEADNREEALFTCAIDRLTTVELAIAEQIMRGYSSWEIAAELNDAQNTIKSYCKNFYSKLQTHSKRELFELVRK